MSPKNQYLFSETLKIATFGASGLLLVVWGLVGLVVWDESIGDRCTSVAGVLSGVGLYMNHYLVKVDLASLFEPPYEFIGVPLGYMVILLSAASIYFQLG